MSGISILSDTNPLIYLLDGNEDVASFLSGKNVWISFISELELFAKKGLTQDEIREINYLIESCIIADINSSIKLQTKKIIQEYQIKLPDAIIAATALEMGLPLLTADIGFQKIIGLTIIRLDI